MSTSIVGNFSTFRVSPVIDCSFKCSLDVLLPLSVHPLTLLLFTQCHCKVFARLQYFISSDLSTLSKLLKGSVELSKLDMTIVLVLEKVKLSEREAYLVLLVLS